MEVKKYNICFHMEAENDRDSSWLTKSRKTEYYNNL